MARFTPIDPVGAYQTGRLNALTIQRQQEGIEQAREAELRAKELQPLRMKEAQLRLGETERQAGVAQQQDELSQALNRTKVLNQTLRALKQTPPEQHQRAIQTLTPMLQAAGVDMNAFTPERLTPDGIEQGIIATGELLRDKTKLSASMQEFKSLVESGQLSEQEESEAARIKLGLSARAPSASPQVTDVGGVPHEYDPVSRTLSRLTVTGDEKPITTESVAKSESIIESATTQASKQADLSADIVKKGYEKTGKIAKNILNIDRAINALDRGANTGVVHKFMPSITEATRELENIQRELGLDIIGAVSFGALSEGELKLALTTALDLRQKPEALKRQLSDKKAAQEKLLAYFNDQISFLSGVNPDGSARTIAQYLEMRRTEQPEQDRRNGVEMIDASGNRAIVYPDGTFREL